MSLTPWSISFIGKNRESTEKQVILDRKSLRLYNKLTLHTFCILYGKVCHYDIHSIANSINYQNAFNSIFRRNLYFIPMNIHGTCMEHSRNIRGTFMKYSYKKTWLRNEWRCDICFSWCALCFMTCLLHENDFTAKSI